MDEEYFDMNKYWVKKFIQGQTCAVYPNASEVKTTSSGLKSNVEEREGTCTPLHAHKWSSTHAKEHMLNHHWSFPGNKKSLCGLNPWS